MRDHGKGTFVTVGQCVKTQAVVSLSMLNVRDTISLGPVVKGRKKWMGLVLNRDVRLGRKSRQMGRRDLVLSRVEVDVGCKWVVA